MLVCWTRERLQISKVRPLLTFFPSGNLLSKVNPRTVRRQEPILERYRTLSATTKPTLKKMFVAGRNGTTTKANPSVRILRRH